MAEKAWRNWYHCVVGTYAQWLPGDPRGWRERDHHEHVEGDYKHPPKPSNFAKARLEHARKLVKGEPYLISPVDREAIGRLLLRSFELQRAPVLSLAVCAKNFHAMIQSGDRGVKKILGDAKRHVTFRFADIIDEQSKQRRKLWESEGSVKPVRDREHGVRVFHYILEHVEEGGWVWHCGKAF